MIMSSFPVWCDDFEMLNPIITNNNIVNISLIQVNNLLIPENAGVSNTNAERILLTQEILIIEIDLMIFQCQ